MLEPPTVDLKIVTADELDSEVRAALRAGEEVEDRYGRKRRLPASYFEIPSWEAALGTQLTRHFGLWELIDVDVREAPTLRAFPRFVPCAITVLASHLQLIRNEVGRVVRIAANGGYRSPAHRHSDPISPHCWGSAANIYRIGDEWLDTREKIEKYIEIARATLPNAWIRPYGDERGSAFDHVHIDLGYVTVDPHAQHGGGERESGNAEA